MNNDFFINGYTIKVVPESNILLLDPQAYVVERFNKNDNAVGQTVYLLNSPFRGGVLDYKQALVNAENGVLPWGNAYASKAMYGKWIIHSTILGLDISHPYEELCDYVTLAFYNIMTTAAQRRITDIAMPAIATDERTGCVDYKVSAECLISVLRLTHNGKTMPMSITVIIPEVSGYDKFVEALKKWHKIEPAYDVLYKQ